MSLIIIIIIVEHRKWRTVAILPVLYGMPQGSVLSPLLFVLYTTGRHDVVAKHGVTLHQYIMPVSDVQLAIDRLLRVFCRLQ